MINFKYPSYYLGRNGAFTSIGLELGELSPNDVVITPVTSMNLHARCMIAIPREDVPKLIEELKRFIQ